MRGRQRHEKFIPDCVQKQRYWHDEELDNAIYIYNCHWYCARSDDISIVFSFAPGFQYDSIMLCRNSWFSLTWVDQDALRFYYRFVPNRADWAEFRFQQLYIYKLYRPWSCFRPVCVLKELSPECFVILRKYFNLQFYLIFNPIALRLGKYRKYLLY